MPAKASLEPSATVSAIAGTRFHHASTARTVRVKACPALWPVGVPCLPLAVPPRAVSPGSSTWRPAIGPGCTVRLLLEPVWGGALKSEQVIDTAPPAPRNVSGPLHRPFTKVMSSGVMLAAPVFASSAAWPVYAGPAPWLGGEPMRPVGLPGSAVWPGSTTCTRAALPGWTVNGSLVPFLDGALWSQA